MDAKRTALVDNINPTSTISRKVGKLSIHSLDGSQIRNHGSTWKAYESEDYSNASTESHGAPNHRTIHRTTDGFHVEQDT